MKTGAGFSTLVAPTISQTAFQQPPKGIRLRSVRCSSWRYADRWFLKLLHCSSITLWMLLIYHSQSQEAERIFVLCCACAYILCILSDLRGSFWTGEAGNVEAALGWRVAGGCELSGDLPVVQWSLCDAEPLHSCSDLENTQWNHVYGFFFFKNRSDQTDGLKYV